MLAERVAAQFAGELCIRPLPFDLPPYQSLLCWAARAHADAGIQWLRSRIAAIIGPA